MCPSICYQAAYVCVSACVHVCLSVRVCLCVCVCSLQNMKAEFWGDLVTVVSSDMRQWSAPESADIIVSELLGSFGDNELSPECLDGAQHFLKGYLPNGISKPLLDIFSYCAVWVLAVIKNSATEFLYVKTVSDGVLRQWLAYLNVQKWLVDHAHLICIATITMQYEFVTINPLTNMFPIFWCIAQSQIMADKKWNFTT